MNRKATLAVLMAGVSWGIISLFIRRLSAAGLGSAEIAFVRMAVAAVAFTGALALFDRKKLHIACKDLWMFIGTGIISVALFNTCYFYTIVHSQASVAVVLLYTSPVFVMLLSALFFREAITPKKVGALAMTVSGCVLVAGVLGGGETVPPLIILTGLASGLFYALYSIFGRVALERYDTLTVTAYTFLFALLGAVFTGNPGHVGQVLRSRPELILWCVGIGLVSTVLPYVLYTWGLARMETGRAAILVAVEPLVGAVLGIVCYGESRNVSKLLGIALILAAIILLNLPEKNRVNN